MTAVKQKNVPALRFPEFTDDWEQRKLSNIANRFDNFRVPITASDRISGDTPYYGANGIQDYVEGFTHEGEFILVAEDGANDLKNYPVQYVNGKVWVNNHAHVIQGKKTITDNRFLMNSIKNFNIEPFLVGGGRAKLNADVMMKLNILLPSFKEQEKIGLFFKQLDNTIVLHQRKLDLLKEQKKGFLQKMFPKNGEKVPELRFPGFTDDWEQRKFGKIVDVKSGRDYKHLNDGDIPVYGTGGYMLSVDKALSYEEHAIGIGRKGTIDKPYLLKAPFWTVDTLFYALPLQNNDLNFVHILFQNVNWKKYDESTGVPSLSKTVINKVIANIPSLEEQQKIGSFFKQLDDTIALHQRKSDLLREQKKTFLQQMFI
ncbi:restriction endonuclease subunit S [Enterococcus sp. 22-H-5-01]|uniref:restriction endonuclease subunit S n=1 Tax=Enterococcus sp. 22-H-5-01 TaxID=3418555 RepID=UPI003CFD7D38